MQFRMRPMWFSLDEFMRYAGVDRVDALRLLSNFRSFEILGPRGGVQVEWLVYVVVFE